MNGMDKPMDPGKRLDMGMYAAPHKARGVKKLPFNLLDAIRAFAKDRQLNAAMGAEFTAVFVKLKMAEWDSYTSAPYRMTLFAYSREVMF